MKIYSIFISKPQWMVGWPYIGFDNEQFKNEFLKKLKKKFPDVEFAGGDIITSYVPEKVEKLKEEIKKSDGLILYTLGLYQEFPPLVKAGNDFLEAGVPTILANYIYGGDYIFILLNESVRRKNLRVVPVSTVDPEKLEETIGILVGLIRLKGKRIVNITLDEPKIKLSEEDMGRLMTLIGPGLSKAPDEAKEYITKIAMGGEYYIDVKGIDQCHQWRRDEEKYRKNLKEIFGVEMVRVHPDELIKLCEKVDEKDAEKIAEHWMSGAQKVVITRETATNSAKLYLAIKELMKEKGADGIAIDCATLMMSGKLCAFSCMAFSQLNSEGSTGVCESDMDCAITMLLGRYITGRPGFIANNAYDLTNNRITYLHCTAPIKPYGPEGPSLDYDILTHGDSRFVGASPAVKYPEGEDMTTVKISVLEKKVAIRHGKTAGSVKGEEGCRNKVLVESNARRILENYDEKTFGWHRVSFIGEFREELITAARLLGLDVVEEDK